MVFGAILVFEALETPSVTVIRDLLARLQGSDDERAASKLARELRVRQQLTMDPQGAEVLGRLAERLESGRGVERAVEACAKWTRGLEHSVAETLQAGLLEPREVRSAAHALAGRACAQDGRGVVATATTLQIAIKSAGRLWPEGRIKLGEGAENVVRGARELLLAKGAATERVGLAQVWFF